MDYRVLADKLFEKGKEKMEELEVFIQRSKEVEIAVFNGEVDNYTISESGGLSLRGVYDDKMGYSYTEKVDESSIDMLVEEAYENSKYIDSLDKEIIFAGAEKYETVDNYKDSLSKTPMEDKIEFLKNLEKEALSLDPRVSSIQVCVYMEFESDRYIMNTKGVDLSDKFSGAYCYIAVVLKDGEETKTGMSFKLFNDLKDVDYKEMAKEAVDEGLSMLGAKPIQSDNYTVIFKNTVFADILSAFSSTISAESVQKGLSLFKDKLGTTIATDVLTIVDNPFLKDGFNTRAFDDEGCNTSYKKIIDKGVLNSYLYNLKTANKDGVASTGNATRRSYKSSIGILPTNLYIERGSKSFEELIGSMESGIYITDVQGLHSGLNDVSGDYSLSAHGYEIENGKIKRPVNQITIASNLLETLMNIEEIGNDLKFGMPMGAYVGSPSIKVKGISVAGE